MKLVFFGLTISSSWGNGHATLLRALFRQLIGRGHHVVFYERDVPYYAAHRDLQELPGGWLNFYQEWEDVCLLAETDLRDADVVMTTSYCPDARRAAECMRECAGLSVFYDLDTPVTLARLDAGETV